MCAKCELSKAERNDEETLVNFEEWQGKQTTVRQREMKQWADSRAMSAMRGEELNTRGFLTALSTEVCSNGALKTTGTVEYEGPGPQQLGEVRMLNSTPESKPKWKPLYPQKSKRLDSEHVAIMISGAAYALLELVTWLGVAL